MSRGRGCRNSSSIPNSKRKRIDAAPPQNHTLGMFWGLNSSASKSKKSSSAFSDFGSYMSEKERKLGLQFQADANNNLLNEGNDRKKGLFKEISIFVDGFTIPSNQELRSYMVRYGGRYENYFSKDKVTHIVCSNLPESKLRNFRSFSRGLPVVKPQWILDSIASNKILPVALYQLEQIANDCPQQQRLSTFFEVKSNVLPIDDSENVKISSLQKGEESALKEIEMNEDVSCTQRCSVKEIEMNKDYSCMQRCSGDYNVATVSCESRCDESDHIAMDSECTGSNLSNLEKVMHLHNDSQTSECETSHQKESTWHKAEDDDASAKTSPQTSHSGKPQTNHLLHSTLGDANFVKNYFKNSRLHFIGTWKNRYRKRFAGKMNKEECEKSVPNTLDTSGSRIVVHIDMDCFFVSVVVRNFPDLADKPVAVCHSDNSEGTAEISSASYPARKYGVKAGMFVRDAKNLCPNLVIMPYDFAAYEEVADQFYDILHKYSNKVQAVSCDEAYLDISGTDDPLNLVSSIRREIFDVTKCTASAGVAENLLLARMATKRAKPNGLYYIISTEVARFLADLPVSEIPGVGYALQEKLKSEDIHNCKQLQQISKEALQREYGSKTGDMLWNYSRGIDNREVQTFQVLKSIGADINWGVRFNDLGDVHQFLSNLSKEVSLRMQDAAVRGRTITLKVKKRKEGAGEPAKFMGCGICDNLSHSVTILSATDKSEILYKSSCQIFASFHVDVQEVRGIGLQVTKLEIADSCFSENEKNTLVKWLSSAPQEKTYQPSSVANKENLQSDMKTNIASRRDKLRDKELTNERNALPHISQLDASVLASLPPEILSEINEAYNTSVLDCIQGKGKEPAHHRNLNATHIDFHAPSTSTTYFEKSLPLKHCRKEILSNSSRKNDNMKRVVSLENGGSIPTGDVQCPMNLTTTTKDTASENVNTRSCPNVAGEVPVVDVGQSSRMESETISLSQVDMSVLYELPKHIQKEILDSMRSNQAVAPETEPLQCQKENTSLMDDIFEKCIWRGDPPFWVTAFKTSKSKSLQLLSDSYDKVGTAKPLSTVLLHLASSYPGELASDGDGCEQSITDASELLKQYIDSKIKNDIDEIYTCFRLIKRLIHKSKFWHTVYESVLSFLQEHVATMYGGILRL